jgi:hypothetical protein
MMSRAPVTPLQLVQRAASPPLPAASAQQAAQVPSRGTQAADAAEEPTEVEIQRRQKISAANKGRTPWNKGRRHSPETIARIRAGTLKAMQRPEVKQRLAQANEKREPHSDEAKVRGWDRATACAWGLVGWRERHQGALSFRCAAASQALLFVAAAFLDPSPS